MTSSLIYVIFLLTVARPPSCGAVRPVDIVFAMPSDADWEETTLALDFFGRVSAEFGHLDGNVSIGLVPKDCNSVDGFFLKESADKDAILERSLSHHHFRPDSAQTIHYICNTAFNANNGARQGADRISVMIVDRNSKDSEETAAESEEARTYHGVDLFFVVVGGQVSDEEIEALTRGVPSERVLRVDRYDQLNSVVKELTTKIHDTCAN